MIPPERQIVAHEHDWQATDWGGRYRCPKCGAWGYRAAIAQEYSRRWNPEILPYTCTHKGCHGWAVAKDPHKPYGQSRRWVCRNHRTKFGPHEPS